jgi:hypothetical protein
MISIIHERFMTYSSNVYFILHLIQYSSSAQMPLNMDKARNNSCIALLAPLFKSNLCLLRTNVYDQISWEVITPFVDIGGLVHHYCLSFLSFTSFFKIRLKIPKDFIKGGLHSGLICSAQMPLNMDKARNNSCIALLAPLFKSNLCLLRTNELYLFTHIDYFYESNQN